MHVTKLFYAFYALGSASGHYLSGKYRKQIAKYWKNGEKTCHKTTITPLRFVIEEKNEKSAAETIWCPRLRNQSLFSGGNRTNMSGMIGKMGKNLSQKNETPLRFVRENIKKKSENMLCPCLCLKSLFIEENS